MSTVTLPRADIPIDRDGTIYPSRDLYRWMRDITERGGGVVSRTVVEVDGTSFSSQLGMWCREHQPKAIVAGDWMTVTDMGPTVTISVDMSQVLFAANSFVARHTHNRPQPNDAEFVLAQNVFGKR